MTLVEELAQFVVSASWGNISQEVQTALKIRVLDSLGCAIGALNGEPVRYIRKHIDEFGGSEMCTMIGGGKTAPDRAAFFNSALIRYLDFNDSYLSKGETCHPSDNLGAVLAAAEYADCSGKEFLTGLAYPNMASCATNATFLAMRCITGPMEVFEGNKGFMESIAGSFTIDWSSENLESVNRTIIKKYNAEIHSQSSIEGVLQLQEEHHFMPEDISHIEIGIFDVAYNIIGGGEEGDKAHIATKEEADHSLPYMVAVSLLYLYFTPVQYQTERIQKGDVQTLLRKIFIKPVDEYSKRFPDRMSVRLTVTLKDSRVFIVERDDYEGFHSRPMPREKVVEKFIRLTESFTDDVLRQKIITAVDNLENINVKELTKLLAEVKNGY